MMRTLKSIAQRRSARSGQSGVSKFHVGVLMLCLFVSEGLTFGNDLPCANLIIVPTYPPLARASRIEGVVTVEMHIAEDGTVVSVNGSGAHALLVEEAEKNLRQWRFAPPTSDMTFPASYKIQLTFKLEGEPKRNAPAPKVILRLPDRVEIATSPPKPHIYWLDEK